MSVLAQSTVVGIDGGGSTTRAAVVDLAGNILGIGVGGPSNYQDIGIEATRRNILEAVDSALGPAGGSGSPFASAFMGMAGVVSEADKNEIVSIAELLGLARRSSIGVDFDLRNALAGAMPGKPGIVLIAGTGSSCFGRRQDGVSWRAGGWGPLLDDLGSAYWIGIQGLSAITRSVDGRGPETTLVQPLTDALSLIDIDHILRRLHHQGTPREEIARLAPLVLEAAEEGDMVAHDIVRHGAEELARMIQAVAENLGWIGESIDAALVGGLMDNPMYVAEISLVAARRAPDVRLVQPQLPPVLGAALLALEIAGVEIAGVAEHMINQHGALQ